MRVICVRCDKCGKLGTKDMKWEQQATADGKPMSETLRCTCGNNQWKFVAKDSQLITSDVLVVNQ